MPWGLDRRGRLDHSAQIGQSFTSYESFLWRQVGFFDNSLSNGDQMLTPCLNEYWRQDDIPALARGYTWNGSVYVHTTFFNSPTLSSGPAGWEGPAGGWTVPIGDLVRLMVAIQNNDIISPATKAQMMSVQGSDDSGNWGLGVNLLQKLGRPVFMHDGAYPGYRARYTVWPNEGFGVAIMANESDADMRDITDDIAGVFLNGGQGARVGAIYTPPVGIALNGPSDPPVPDDDDPGLGGLPGEETSLPVLADKDRRELLEDLRRLEAVQAQDEARELLLARRVARSGCVELAEAVQREHGIDLRAVVAGCLAASKNHGVHRVRQPCLNDLLRRESSPASRRECCKVVPPGCNRSRLVARIEQRQPRPAEQMGRPEPHPRRPSGSRRVHPAGPGSSNKQSTASAGESLEARGRQALAPACLPEGSRSWTRGWCRKGHDGPEPMACVAAAKGGRSEPASQSLGGTSGRPRVTNP
jgi:hypothetical protein